MSKEIGKIRIPKLRFPQFQNESGWKERRLTEVLNEHGAKSEGSEEVFSVSVHKGVINQIEHLGRVFSAASTDNYKRVLPGDVIYTKSPTGDFPYGIVKQSKIGKPVIVSPLYGVFTPETQALGYLLDAYFESPSNAYNYLASIVQKGAKNTINIANAAFLSKALYLPSNKDEQQKIADCLSSLDKIIIAQGQKLELLKTHKRGLMQQLFSAEGEIVPKLRFTEFVRNLKRTGFAELGEIKIGLTHTPNYIDAGVIFLSSKNISKGYIDFKNVQYISREEFESMPESTKPKIGDILFTRVGSNLGNPIILEENKEFGIFVSLGVFRVNKKVSNYYIKYWMESEYFWFQLIRKVAGGAKNNLNTNWLKEFELYLPDLPEQQKIASVLSSLDKLITAQSEKIESLKAHKIGLMQQLFPSINEDKDEQPE